MGNTQSNQPAPKTECKPCCACPETRKLRDDCILVNGEELCKKQIEDHKLCLKKLGFD